MGTPLKYFYDYNQFLFCCRLCFGSHRGFCSVSLHLVINVTSLAVTNLKVHVTWKQKFQLRRVLD